MEDTKPEVTTIDTTEEGQLIYPGEGYRLLGQSEIVQNSDEVLNQSVPDMLPKDIGWTTKHCYGGETAGSCVGFITGEPRYFRRKIEQVKILKFEKK